MKSDNKEIKKGIILGAIAGVVWGWVAYGVNFLSGAFPFEDSLIYNLTIFSIGGAIFGILVGGFMVVVQEKLPFKKPFLKVVLLSTIIWVILRVGGFFLTLNAPLRFHPVTVQTIQGFVLAIILGCILGYLWERGQKATKTT